MGDTEVNAILATNDGEPTALVPASRTSAALSQAAAAADRAASSALFADYRQQLAAHTRSAHDQDLARCALYLADVGVAVGALALDPVAWAGFTWGLVEGFKHWMLREGYALATINRTLATTKSYVRLAAQAGALPTEQAALIAAVKGYGRKQGRNLDADRTTTRRSPKKAEAVRLSLASCPCIEGATRRYAAGSARRAAALPAARPRFAGGRVGRAHDAVGESRRRYVDLLPREG
jgi:hypothetical protein